MASRVKSGAAVAIVGGCFLLGSCVFLGAGAYMFWRFRSAPSSAGSYEALEPMESAEPASRPATPVPESSTDGTRTTNHGAKAELRVSNFKLTDDGYRTDRGGRYRRGERIHYRYDIHGLAREAGDWDLKMTLTVTAPTGEIVLDQTMVDQRGSDREPLPLTGHVDLPPQAPEGTYTLRAVTRDKIAGVEVVEEHRFTVSG